MPKEKTKHLLVLEFEPHRLKMVRLAIQGSRLTWLDSRTISDTKPVGEAEDEHELKTAAASLFRDINPQSEQLTLSVNDPNTYFASFALPKMPKREVLETLKWKMKEELPFPLEEAQIDFRLFDQVVEGKSAGYTALVTAVPREISDRVLNRLPHDDFSISTANVIFSLSSLPKTFPRSGDTLTVLVNIDQSVTELSFYAEKKLIFLRKLPYGVSAWARALTQPIATETGVVSLSPEEVEILFREEDVLMGDQQKKVFSKIEVSRIFPLLRSEIEKFEKEMERSLNYYFQEHGSSPYEIYFAGAGSTLKGLLVYFKSVFQVPVYPVDLSGDMTISDSIKTQDLNPYVRLALMAVDRKEHTPSAMAAFDRSVIKVLEKIPFKTVLTVWILTAVLLFAGMFFRYHQITAKTNELRQQVENLKTGFGHAQEVQSIENQILHAKIISSVILEKEPNWDEVFKELAYIFSDRTVLTNAQYTNHAFILTGSAEGDAESSVSNMMQKMEGPVFKNPQLVKTEWRNNIAYFTIRCEVT